tara:strand:- start:844 stop:2322 length:1479 start_codon:yes stop_codon:yes gene_type:complete
MGILKLLSTLLIKLFSIIALVVVARYLDAENLGIFAFTISYVTMFMVIGNLGFGEYYLKIISEGSDKPKANGTFICLSLGSLILINSLVFLSLYITESTSHKGLILISLLIINIEFLNKTMRYFLVSQYKIAIYSLTRIAGLFLQSFSKVVLTVLFSSLIYVYVSNIIGLTFICLTYAFYLRKEPLSYPNKTLLISFFSFSIPLYFVKTINAFYERGIPLVIFMFYGEILAGLYYVSLSITQPLYLFSSSIGAVMLVSISKKLHESDFSRLGTFINNYERIINTVILPLILIFILLKSEIINCLFGGNYSDAQYLIPFLALSFYFSSITVPYSNVLLLSSRFKLILLSQLFCLGFSALSFILLANQHIAINGISSNLEIIGFSILIYYLSRSLITRLFVFKFYSLMISKTNFYKLIIFCLSLYILGKFYLSLNDYDIGTIWFIAVNVFLAFIVYFGLLTVFGQFEREDVDLILSAINPTKFKKEVIEEIRFD